MAGHSFRIENHSASMHVKPVCVAKIQCQYSTRVLWVEVDISSVLMCSFYVFSVAMFLIFASVSSLPMLMVFRSTSCEFNVYMLLDVKK